MTFIMMTLYIMTLSIKTPDIPTFSIMTFNIKSLGIMTLKIIYQWFNIVNHETIIFNKVIGWGLSCSSKIPFGSPTISKIFLSTYVKTSRSVHIVTSSRGRQLETYLTDLTTPAKPRCPNKKNKRLGNGSIHHGINYLVSNEMKWDK